MHEKPIETITIEICLELTTKHHLTKKLKLSIRHLSLNTLNQIQLSTSQQQVEAI